VTPQELTKRLAAGQVEPLYLVVGEESWLADQALAALRRYAAATDDLMNTHVFSGADVTPIEVVAMAQTLPALALRRFIVVRDAERLPAADALTAYCTDPSPSTCLVFVMAKPDRRKGWVQALADRAATVLCDPLKPAALKAWLQREASSRGLSLTEEGAAYLLARSEGSLRGLAQDLEKLALNQRDSPKLPGIQDLAALSPGETNVSVFDWAHAVAMGRTADAAAYAARLLRDEAPLLLLSILAGQWRKMLRYRALVADGSSGSKASQALGLPPFAASRVSEAAQRRTMPELIGGLTWCLETDAAVKGGALSPAIAIERLVLALCASSPPPSGRALTGAWWPGLSARGESVGVLGKARNQP
jgi:DNA polymerase-3 subunit delta